MTGTSPAKEAATLKLISAASCLAGYASSLSDLGTRKAPQDWIDGLLRRITEYQDCADSYFTELQNGQ